LFKLKLFNLYDKFTKLKIATLVKYFYYVGTLRLRANSSRHIDVSPEQLDYFDLPVDISALFHIN
jgi:hypothetical protein